jgi:hypothetical protein
MKNQRERREEMAAIGTVILLAGIVILVILSLFIPLTK